MVRSRYLVLSTRRDSFTLIGALELGDSFADCGALLVDDYPLDVGCARSAYMVLSSRMTNPPGGGSLRLAGALRTGGPLRYNGALRAYGYQLGVELVLGLWCALGGV